MITTPSDLLNSVNIWQCTGFIVVALKFSSSEKLLLSPIIAGTIVYTY